MSGAWEPDIVLVCLFGVRFGFKSQVILICTQVWEARLSALTLPQDQTPLPAPMTSTASTDLTLGTRLQDFEIVQLNLLRHVSCVKWVYGR